MKEACLLSILLILTLQAEYFRLNTNQIRTLTTNDYLTSTLGNFRARLLTTPCSLSIQQLQGQTYKQIGNYTPPSVTVNCRNITISDGTVKTENNSIFLALNAGLQFNISTILTIDDWGVIRLIGTYKTASLTDYVSKQLKIQNFKREVNFIMPASELQVSFTANFDPITNLRKWMFIVFAGSLQISHYDDEGIQVKFNFAKFIMNNSQIYDFNNDFFPQAIFPNITYTPRCLEPRLYLNFKPPFVFVADPYWPIFRLYEQGRYKVVEVNLNGIQQTQAWNSYRRLQFRNQPNVCPPYTFQHKGECVTACPSPYYHQMRSLYGFCVRTCEEYTPKNQAQRTCNCFPQYESSIVKLKILDQCPLGSVSYPYGCYCNETGKYFDRTLSWSCVTVCPNNTFGSNGLCMECPYNCQTCQVDRLYRSYLQCKVCQIGFKMINGKCYRQCNPGKGQSLINGECKSCSDPNCIDCTSDVNVCKKCSLLYVIEANKCVQTCSQNSAVVPIYGFSGICKLIDPLCTSFGAVSFKDQHTIKCYYCPDQKPYALGQKCLKNCPSGYLPNANATCVCSNSSLAMLGTQCLSISFCPMGHGHDPLTGGCTLCYYGCLTCYNLGCTSCSPGFFLYISPQTVICRRKSPLFPCDEQYSWTQQTCLAIQYASPELGLDKCLRDIKNCKACIPGVDEPSCALCQPGFFNLNNTCVTSCPNGTLAVDNLACVPYDLQNCDQPYLGLQYQEFTLNYDLLVNSKMYRFYTASGLEYQNDPVGNIPVYQQMIRRKNDGSFRNSQFFNAKWTCLKCSAGYGLSSDFSLCTLCPSNCLTCYMARNDSCLKPKGDTSSSSNCTNYISKTTGKCVTSCGGASQTPQIINGILYCIPANEAQADAYVRVDSAIYTMPDGKNHIFFVLDDQVTSPSTVTVNLNKVSQRPKLSAGPGSSQIVNAANDQAKVPVSSGSYVYYYDNNPSNPYYLVNFTGKVSSLVTSDNKALPNTIYGSSPSSSHPQFMKTWLAYIGYIMGITIILLQVVYVGNDLLYKADNLVILGQTIYFFSFVHLLVGKLLSQFYYGWIFTHFGFFPNFFSPTIPSSYFQPAAPNSFKLATLDTNIIRNGGYAFSLLIVFIGAYAFIAISCYIAKNLLQKPDMWHPRIATNSLIGGLEFLSMAIFYWSVANLLYLEGANKYDSSFYTTSKSVSIFFICLISIYTIIRWFFHHIGGLYMAKRILLATTLAASYQNQQMMAPLILIEFIFAISRYLMQRPQKSRDKYFLILEELMIIGTYLLLWLSLDAGTNTIIISIFMFILIVAIAHDLTDVYLESRNQWEVEDQQQTDSEQMAKAEADYTKKNSAVSKMY